MPKILEYFGIVFYFYSNEHLPIHVHVSYNEFESIFEIVFEDGTLKHLTVRKSGGKEPLPPQQFRDAQKVIEAHASDIVNCWTDFFVLKKKVSVKRISKKL